MKTVNHYATPRQVQEIAIKRHDSNQPNINFPEAIGELFKKGKLLEKPLPKPYFKNDMSIDEFDSYLLDQPFDATNILRHAYNFDIDPNIHETELFPTGKDVFCFKHLPYMDEVPHTHEYFELTLLCKGSYKLLFEDEAVTMNEGDLCIVPPMSPHNQPLDPSCTTVGICVRRSTFDAIFGNLLTQKDLVSSFFRNSLYGPKQNNYLKMKTELTPQIMDTVKKLAYESHNDDSYANSCCVSLINLFLVQLLRKYSDTITLYSFDKTSRKDFDFALVLRYIQQNYRTVTLSSLSKTFNFSEAYMSKFIKKHFNQSFVSLLRDLKMHKAQDYLLNTNMKISNVAELLGYISVDHFSRTFKKTYGISQSVFKTQSQKN